jgi:hypothetical protein
MGQLRAVIKKLGNYPIEIRKLGIDASGAVSDDSVLCIIGFMSLSKRRIGNPPSSTLEFRITVTINGQRYSYPTDFIYVQENAASREVFPVIGDEPYHIGFEGKIIRDEDQSTLRTLRGMIDNDFGLRQFPATNQTNSIVIDTTL